MLIRGLFRQKTKDPWKTFSYFQQGERKKSCLFLSGFYFTQENTRKSWESAAQHEDKANMVRSPLPGKVIKIDIEEGQAFSKNDRLFVLESMKMELEIKASSSGVMQHIHVDIGDRVQSQQPLGDIS